MDPFEYARGIRHVLRGPSRALRQRRAEALARRTPPTRDEHLSGSGCTSEAIRRTPSSPSRPPIPGLPTHASARLALVAAQEQRTGVESRLLVAPTARQPGLLLSSSAGLHRIWPAPHSDEGPPNEGEGDGATE